MAAQDIVNRRGEVIIPDPPFARALLGTTRFAWLWLILRVYLGWQWLSANGRSRPLMTHLAELLSPISVIIGGSIHK